MVHAIVKQCHQTATSTAAQALLCLHVTACSLTQRPGSKRLLQASPVRG